VTSELSVQSQGESDGDYVLGTHAEEIARLGLQHRVWRPRALDAWRRAGFTVGQTLLDVGCGPGHATVDLAEIVGPSGRVFAIDRSRRFLEALEATANRRGLTGITTFEIDLDEGALPSVEADGAWVRWVFAFVKQPRALLTRVRDSLKPGGSLVLHEYFDYATWRVTPRSSDFEGFVRTVMTSWRATGGEPDIGLQLPPWLEELGFEIRELRPIIDIVAPSNFVWQWPKTFVDVGLRRLIELGYIDEEGAARVRDAFATIEATPHARLVTPAVLEIIAVRRE
jgi:SAM-dependent methyltransferase